MASPVEPELSAQGTSDITLTKRVLSTREVLAQSVANMAPSAAMALLPLFVFASAGNALWLSLLSAAGRRGGPAEPATVC
jgi:hypothetical protein